MSISPKQGKGDKIVVNEVKCTNGETVSFEGMSYYPKLTVGEKTWHWDRNMCKYGGVSCDGDGD